MPNVIYEMPQKSGFKNALFRPVFALFLLQNHYMLWSNYLIFF
jgi:hypothetical protein